MASSDVIGDRHSPACIRDPRHPGNVDLKLSEPLPPIEVFDQPNGDTIYVCGGPDCRGFRVLRANGTPAGEPSGRAILAAAEDQGRDWLTVIEYGRLLGHKIAPGEELDYARAAASWAERGRGDGSPAPTYEWREARSRIEDRENQQWLEEFRAQGGLAPTREPPVPKAPPRAVAAKIAELEKLVQRSRYRMDLSVVAGQIGRDRSALYRWRANGWLPDALVSRLWPPKASDQAG